jgi:hypothetical protein
LDRFIVGSGRCGSTLLSKMISEHPDVLSLFEVFNGLDMGRRFADAVIAGEAFAEMLAAPQPFINAVVRRGYPVEEVKYPYADAPEGPNHGRHRRSDALPWLLVSMLPRLSDDPDALFEDTLAFARAQPARGMRDHYRSLFDWLGARFGRPCWVERSGSSVDYAGDLARVFPEARIVHLHRAGPEVALSMRAHHAYRLPISLLYDVEIEPGRRVSQCPPLALEAAPTPGDTISRILASRPDPAAFGRYWSDQVARGVAGLATLPAERVRVVSFEQLLSAPLEVMRALAAFFDLPERPGWAERAAALVREPPRPRIGDLDEAERSALLSSCSPGQASLEAGA